MSDRTDFRGELHLSSKDQLELLRGMQERGASLRTTARGWSMAPFIHDQDVVTIATGPWPPPRLGDVLAAEVSPGPRLVIHRAV
ncbi:MAG TPA: S24/S26 family peptidase, partial [Thermoleophilia bacterium]|nr:S24/S26 family peptidase [Thermoleophilia bacterium]